MQSLNVFILICFSIYFLKVVCSFPIGEGKGALNHVHLHGRHRAAATSASPEPHLHLNLPSFLFFHTIYISATYCYDQRHAALEIYNLLMLDAFSCRPRGRIRKFLGGLVAARQNFPQHSLAAAAVSQLYLVFSTYDNLQTDRG